MNCFVAGKSLERPKTWVDGLVVRLMRRNIAEVTEDHSPGPGYYTARMVPIEMHLLTRLDTQSEQYRTGR